MNTKEVERVINGEAGVGKKKVICLALVCIGNNYVYDLLFVERAYAVFYYDNYTDEVFLNGSLLLNES